MRLTALCICGTLLAFSSLSQMTAGEGVLLGDQEFGPCTATLKPGGKCSPGEHNGRCPYLFSLPPLTVHFPQQLRELEKIMQDLQKLKDSVDELREMCEDCTVSQSDRGCGKQREREHETLDEGKSTRDNGRKWMNVSPEENDRGFRQKCGKDVVKMEKMDDNDAGERLILDENTARKWEADRISNKGVIKENERERTRIEETEKDRKTKTENERKKGPSEQTKMTTGANVVDIMSEKAAETNNDEEEVNENKEEEGKDNSKRHKEDRLEKEGERTMTTTEQNKKGIEGNDPQMWRDETKKKEENTQPKGGDEIKMSENQGEHKNKEQERDNEEKTKAMEKRIKEGQNEGKTKQTENIGETETERTIKAGELDQKGREMEKEIEMGSVWKDSDEELSSSTATEHTDFVSISPTSRSTTRLASRFESMDSIKAKIFTSSLPSPPLPSPTLSSITDVSRDTEAVYGRTTSTGPGAAGFPEPQSLDEEDLTTIMTTTTTVGGLTQQTPSFATGSNSPSIIEAGDRFQGHASSTTSTTSSHPKLYTNSFPRPTDKSRWTPKKNFGSNTKTGLKPQPGKGPKPGENLKPGVKPQAEQKLKNPKNDRKPEQAPLPDKTKYNQKLKLFPHKPTTNKSKKAKDSKQTQVSNPNQPTPPDALATDKNLKQNQNRSQTDQNPTFYQKSVTPVPRSTTQSPQRMNTTYSDKDSLMDRKPGSDKVPDQNRKAEKKQLPTKQKPEKHSKEKTKSNKRVETDQNPTPVEKPDSKVSQTTTFTTKPNQKHPTESLDKNHSHEPESNSDPEQKIKSDHTKKPYNQKPKSNLKVPKLNQKHNPGGERESEQSKTAPPKPNQQPLTESVNKSDKNYTHKSKSDPDSILQVIKYETTTPPDQRVQLNKKIPKINQKPKPGQEPGSKRSETATPKPNQHLTESEVKSDENHSQEPKSDLDIIHGQTIRSDLKNTPPDQKPETNKKIPKMNQKPKPGQEPGSKRSETATPKPNQHLTESEVKSDENPSHEPKSDPDSAPGQTNKSDQTNTPPDQRVQLNKNIIIDNQRPQPNQVPVLKRNETATPKPNQHLTESEVKSDENHSQEPKSDPDIIHGQTIRSDQKNTRPDQKPETNKKIPKMNQKPKPGHEPASERSETATPEPNQRPVTESGDKSDQKNTPPDQKPETNKKTNQKPKPGQEPGSKRSETVTPEPNQRPVTESGNKSDINYTHELKSDPDTMPGKKIKSKTNTSPDQRLEFNKKVPKTNQKPKPGQEPGSERSETTTPKPNQHLTESEVKSDENHSHEPKSDPDSAPGQTIKSDQTKKVSDQKPKSTLKTFKIKPYPDQEPESERSETVTPDEPHQRPVTESVKTSDKNYTQEPKSDPDSAPGQKIKSDQTNTPPDQKPETNKKVTKINHRLNPDSERSETATPEPNQRPVTESGKTSDKNPLHESKSNQDSVQTTSPGQDNTPAGGKPKLKPGVSKINQKPKPGQVFKPKQKPKPPTQFRPKTRPIVKPGLKPIQRPKPEVQPKLNQRIKTHSDPPQISWTASNSIQNSQTTSGVIKQTAEVTRSQRDQEFSASITVSPKTSNSLETGPNPHRLPEDFTLSPNSRIMSDLKPQTTSPPSSIQMTTRPNKINRGVLQSVITSTSPGPTHPSVVAKSKSRTQTLHNVKEARPPTSVLSPSSQTTSTPSLVFGSTPPVTSGPKTPAAEQSTPSTRELRVKINQVAAFLNNSLNPKGRPEDMLSKVQPEGTQGGDRPATDSKLPTPEPSKARRDCSDHLLRGETKSGVYLVTPDLRSRSFPVFCDMKRDGGGWTLLQRRQDGSVSFNRTWAEYQSGFGQLGGEFWLGNNMIHLLTRDRDMMLRIELEDFHGVKEYAQYEQFRVAGARLRFRLTVSGYSGTAGDALRFNTMYDHNNKAFTTPDRDHDRYPSGNCGAYYGSGWWFDACMAANLNGKYYTGTYKGVRDGIFWGTWHNISNEYYPTNDRQSFKTVRMMIRPKGFAP